MGRERGVMGTFGGIIIQFFALVLLILLQYLILNLVLFLKRSWWDPMRITKSMAAQGIHGPPYKFFFGTTAEVRELTDNSMAKFMELSHNILPRIQPHFHSWTKLYGKNVLTWLGTTPRLLVGEPELVKEVLNDKEGRFMKSNPPELVKKLFGGGLVISEGPKWARQRKIANQAFHADNLKGMIPAIIASVEAMLQNWTKFEDKEVEFYKEFSVLTSEIISRTAFGSSYIEGKDIFTKIDELNVIAARHIQSVKPPCLRKIIRNKDEVEADKLEQEIRASLLNVANSRTRRKENGDADDYGDDLLGLLMQAHHETGTITVEDFIAECKTFYLTGQETTSIMLSWTCLLLALNIDWQDRLRTEVRQIFGDRSPRSKDFPAIAKLKTMNMVANESLRLYPPVLNLVRTTARKCKLGDYHIPRGMQILISPLVLHHDLTTWGDEAQLFKPERFADGVAGATASIGNTAYLPFGSGPRFCVGQGLAMLEAKIALAMILQRYSLTLSPAYAHSPAPLLTCRPLHGIQAIIHKV